MPRFKFTFDLVTNKTSCEQVANDAALTPPRATLGGQVIAVYDFCEYADALFAMEAMKQGIHFGFNGCQQLKIPIDLDLGRVAYEGYFRASDGKSLVSGAALPTWDDSRAEIQQAWRAGAVAVLRAAFPEENAIGG
jgi:hypothetical protein